MSGDDATYKDIDQNIAANVRAYREAKGISQEELAQRMAERGFGFSQATVWKIESGQRPVRASELIAFADALDILTPTRLTYKPETTKHSIQLQDANGAAYAAYHAVKAAAADYLRAQVDLVFVAREAYDAGFPVTEVHTSWLTTSPEQAVFESRIEVRHEEELGDHRFEEVNKILGALRSSGYEPNLRIEDVSVHEGGSIPPWKPGNAELHLHVRPGHSDGRDHGRPVIVTGEQGPCGPLTSVPDPNRTRPPRVPQVIHPGAAPHREAFPPALVECARYVVLGRPSQLDSDELIQPFWVRLIPSGLLKLLPGLPFRGIAHGDHAHSVGPADPASLIDDLLHRLVALIGHVVDHVGVRGAP